MTHNDRNPNSPTHLEFPAQLLFEAPQQNPHLAAKASGRLSGTLSCASQGVEFCWDEGKALLPFVELRIRSGGTNHRLIFFEHPEFPGLTMTTTDRAFLKHEDLHRFPELQSQIASLQRSSTGRWALLAICLAALIFLMLAAWSYKPYAIDAILAQIDPAHEVRMGNQLFDNMSSSWNFIENPKALELLQKLATPLLQTVAEEPYEFKIHIIEDPSVNAFAIPGGIIVLHSALLLEAQSPEQVLGVLAHEIAHVTHRHSLRALLDRVGVTMIIRFSLGDSLAILSLFGDFGPQLMALNFSREQESAADQEAIKLLLKAKINPRGLLEFLGQIDSKDPNNLSILRTHPSSEARLHALATTLKKIESSQLKYLSFDQQFEELQQLLR